MQMNRVHRIRKIQLGMLHVVLFQLFLVQSVIAFESSLNAQVPQKGQIQNSPSGDAQIITKRFVEIEFEAVEGALNYDLEIYNNKTKKFIKAFSSKTSAFKLNVKMGTYLIRSRITDIYQRTSEWSELTEMVIAPPPAKLTSKAPDLSKPVFADKKTNTFSTELTWGALPGVEKYMIVAETPEGEKVAEYSSHHSNLKLDLSPGVYRFKVMAILSDGTIGEPSSPSDIYSILGAKILPPRLAFKKNNEGQAYIQVNSELKNAVLDGTLFYQPWESEVWSVVQNIENAEMADIQLDQKLTPGKYKISLKAVAKGYSSSEENSVEFIIKPKLPDIASIQDEITMALQGKDSQITPENSDKFDGAVKTE